MQRCLEPYVETLKEAFDGKELKIDLTPPFVGDTDSLIHEIESYLPHGLAIYVIQVVKSKEVGDRVEIESISFQVSKTIR